MTNIFGQSAPHLDYVKARLMCVSVRAIHVVMLPRTHSETGSLSNVMPVADSSCIKISNAVIRGYFAAASGVYR